MVLTMQATLWISYGVIITKSHSDLKDGNFAKCSDTPLTERSERVLWFLSWQQQFEVLTVKSSLNPITT